jgi:hypothetical protein
VASRQAREAYSDLGEYTVPAVQAAFREAFDRGAVTALREAAAIFGRDTPEGRDLIHMANAWEEASGE